MGHPYHLSNFRAHQIETQRARFCTNYRPKFFKSTSFPHLQLLQCKVSLKYLPLCYLPLEIWLAPQLRSIFSYVLGSTCTMSHSLLFGDFSVSFPVPLQSKIANYESQVGMVRLKRAVNHSTLASRRTFLTRAVSCTRQIIYRYDMKT